MPGILNIAVNIARRQSEAGTVLDLYVIRRGSNALQ